MMAGQEMEGKKRPRRWWWVAAGLCLVGGLAWGGMCWAGHSIQQKMDARLAEVGLRLERRWVTWDPVRGMHVSGARLMHADGRAMAAAGAVEVDFPLGQFFGNSGGLVTDWQISREDVRLWDREGEVRLENVSVKLRATPGEVRIYRVEARKEGMVAELQGKVLLGKRAPGEPRRPVELNLGAVRGTLAALEMKRGGGTFHVGGNFFVDARLPEPLWKAELGGWGQSVEWQGVPLRAARAEARLSQDGAQITADLTLPRGQVDFILTREAWRSGVPFLFQGTLRDEKGRTDEFVGSYGGKERRMKIDSLKGGADLWMLAEDVPMVAGKLPEQVKFKTFPELVVRDLVRDAGGGQVRWSVGAAEVEGKVGLETRRGELVISDVRGGAAYDGEAWQLKNVRATVMGGRVAVTGRYREQKLAGASVQVEGMRVAALKEWLEGEKSGSPGLLHADYEGEIDMEKQALVGTGRMRLENAPVIETPLLDETYDLFTSVIPGVERAKEGEFQAAFRGRGRVMEVTEFEAKGGALTVSAKGTIDLRTERVKGTARGKLGGVPGLVTSPLSRLLEMEVEGPVDNIRLKPLGPVKLASNAASGTVGVAVDTVGEVGRITGEVLKEGVKLPFKWLGKEKSAPK